MIARAYWLALMLTARLAYAQDFEGVQVIGSDNARVNVIVMKDSAFLSMLMPDGSSFAVRDADAEQNGHPVAVRTQQRYAFTLTSQ